MLVIECDEHQHAHFTRECEELRMKNIGQDLGGIPVCFIRYNPDAYINSHGARGTVSTKRRMVAVVKMAEYIKNQWEPGSLVSVVYMYYDYDGEQSKKIQAVEGTCFSEDQGTDSVMTDGCFD